MISHTTSNKRTSGSPAGSAQTSAEASDVRIPVNGNPAGQPGLRFCGEAMLQEEASQQKEGDA